MLAHQGHHNRRIGESQEPDPVRSSTDDVFTSKHDSSGRGRYPKTRSPLTIDTGSPAQGSSAHEFMGVHVGTTLVTLAAGKASDFTAVTFKSENSASISRRPSPLRTADCSCVLPNYRPAIQRTAILKLKVPCRSLYATFPIPTTAPGRSDGGIVISNLSAGMNWGTV